MVDTILQRMIFDDEDLGNLLAPLALDWRARMQKKEAGMKDLIPLLNKRRTGRDIAGLGVDEP